MTERLLPVAAEIFVPDVSASVAYYIDSFGFAHLRSDPDGAWQRGEPLIFALLGFGEAHLLIAHENIYAGPKLDADRGSGVDIRIMVEDVDAVYARGKTAGADIVHDIADRNYGLRDFITRDPDGFRIRFASPIAGAAAH
jgi:uncharacterized glyoxalase superfamily protein PhnB